MIWTFYADAVTFVHVLWIVAVVCGPLWACKNLLIRFFHLIMLWMTFFVGMIGYCPLTIMENSLRAHYDPSSVYASGFISHYLEVLTSWGPPRELIMSLISVWTVLWTIVYIVLWIKKRKK